MRAILLALALAGSVFARPLGHNETGTQRKSSSYHEGAGVLDYVNPLIGTYGTTPNGNGGCVCEPLLLVESRH